MKKLAAFVLAAGLLTACAQERIYDVTARPVPLSAQSLALADIEKIIVEAGQSRGWKFETVAPGKLRASQDQPKHSASVDILFDQKSFSIKHVSTRGMKEQGDVIHPHYNFWIRNLENDIQVRLTNAKLLRP